MQRDQLKQVIFGLQAWISEIATIPQKFVKKIVIIVGQDGNKHECEMFGGNLEFILQDRQDIVKNWIYSSLSPDYLIHLTSKHDASEYWQAIAKVFNDDSQARLMDLKWRLQSLGRTNQTMEQYISVAKDLTDHILAAGDTISDREQILYVLGGLDSDYTSLVTTITSKKRILPLAKVSTCIRMHE